jgi:hypothetical protein
MRGIGLIILIILYFLIFWGWTLLGTGGLCILLSALWAKQRRGRVLGAVFLIVVAIVWGRGTMPWTFGVTTHHLRTRAGDVEVFVRQEGVAYVLTARMDGGKYLLALWRREPPTSVFWIEEGKKIGVECPGAHFIFDIETVRRSVAPRPPEEERSLPWGQLSPDEERLFEAAKRAATEKSAP